MEMITLEEYSKYQSFLRLMHLLGLSIEDRMSYNSYDKYHEKIKKILRA